jgi:hypothetical protein
MSLVKLQYVENYKWYLTNPYVKDGYRSPRSPLKAFLSAFELHNDNLNIYSHLLPGLIWLYMAFDCVKEDYYMLATPTIQYIIHFAYSSGACMGITSAFAHTFNIIDIKWASFSWKCDFIGIVIVNLAHQILNAIILFRGVSLVIGLECAFAAFCIRDIIIRDRMTIHWNLTYPLITSVMTIPAVGAAWLSDSVVLRQMAYHSACCTGFVITAGLVFFKGRIPERFWRSDFLNSHVFHHLCIVAGIHCAFNSIPLFYLL